MAVIFLYYCRIPVIFSSVIEFVLNKLQSQPEPKPEPEPEPTITLIIDQSDELYNAAKSHLSALLLLNGPPDLNACICPLTYDVLFYLGDNEIYEDQFEGITITWKSVSKSYLVSFCVKHYQQVVHCYFPYMSNKLKAIIRDNKAILHTTIKLSSEDDGKLRWGDGKVHASITTFDTLIMDSEIKKIVINDLDRLIAGEVVKRGYLLFGPPNFPQGRNQFLSAMSNYLGYFHKYTFDLDMLRDEDDLKILMATSKKSILVCNQIHISNESKMSLSRFLKFLDGLSSSCLEERIIVFTTAYEDKIDQSLFLPGGLEQHVCNTFYAPSIYKLHNV